MSKGSVNRLTSLETRVSNIELDVREIRKDQSVMKGDIGRILGILETKEKQKDDKRANLHLWIIAIGGAFVGVSGLVISVIQLFV